MAKVSVLQSLRDIGDVWVEVLAVAGTSASNYVYNAACPRKVRVIDFWIVNTSAAGQAATATLKDGDGNAISASLSTNQSDKVVTRNTTIDDTYHELTAGGTLNVALSATNGSAFIAYVMLVAIA